jgi:hypothetical protein
VDRFAPLAMTGERQLGILYGVPLIPLRPLNSVIPALLHEKRDASLRGA